MESNHAVQAFETSGGGRIYQILLELFPEVWGYAYLVLVDDLRVLIDAGSGFGCSNDQLETGLWIAGQLEGQAMDFADLTHIFITHGHIDHYGGLSHIRARTPARLGIHELDCRILTRYEETSRVAIRKIGRFLGEAGVSQRTGRNLLDLYESIKGLYHSVGVDFTFEAVGMRVGPFEFLHVPGHSAGHVVIRLHDVLFGGDHILNDISPHQAPESLTLYTGLGHYLESLTSLKSWAGDVRLTLSGHDDPITNLPRRLDAIRLLHQARLRRILELLAEPHTLAEVSRSLFGETNGYHILLALEETAAHIEYLYQRGLLGIANLSELEASDGVVPILYCEHVHEA